MKIQSPSRQGFDGWLRGMLQTLLITWEKSSIWVYQSYPNIFKEEELWIDWLRRSWNDHKKYEGRRSVGGRWPKAKLKLNKRVEKL